MIDSVLRIHDPALHATLSHFAVLDVAVPKWYVSLFLDGNRTVTPTPTAHC